MMSAETRNDSAPTPSRNGAKQYGPAVRLRSLSQAHEYDEQVPQDLVLVQRRGASGGTRAAVVSEHHG